jgi:hypothetical protein
MQKVYLLLRNNRQSGPYTIDQLWQQQLRPTDMVWIEGQSTAWCYVSELELKPSISPSGIPDTCTISPRDEIERKAEELRRRALVASQPGTPLNMRTVAVKRRRNEDDESEEETIDFIDHRKEKKNIFAEVVMTLFIIAFLAGGIYSGQNFFKGQKSAAVPAVTKISSDDRHAAAAVIHEQDPPHDSLTQQQQVANDTSASSSDTFAVASAPKPKISPVKQHAKDTTTKQAPIIPIPLENTETTVESPEKPLPDSANKEVAVEAKPPVVSDQPEKKKGFLKGIFRKKKKDDEKTAEEKNGSQENQ